MSPTTRWSRVVFAAPWLVAVVGHLWLWRHLDAMPELCSIVCTWQITIWFGVLATLIVFGVSTMLLARRDRPASAAAVLAATGVYALFFVFVYRSVFLWIAGSDVWWSQ